MRWLYVSGRTQQTIFIEIHDKLPTCACLMRDTNTIKLLSMACYLTSFLTAFQLYQDDGSVIMKGCVQCNPVQFLERFSPQGGVEPWTARSTISSMTSTLHMSFLNFERLQLDKARNQFLLIALKNLDGRTAPRTAAIDMFR